MTLIVSLIAVSLALFFGALAWKLARAERARSAARVVALGAAIDQATSTAPASTVNVQPAFLAQERPAASRGGVIKVAAGFAGAVALIVILATMGSGEDRRTSQPGGSPGAPTATQEGSLELLSMRHERVGDALTVTGLVRNGGSTPAQRLIAVVFTFDRNGNFVASGRAPLEFVTLAPTDESPFRVSVPNAGEVGRYRVSFRTEAGVVRHTDRRQALVARSTE